MMFPVVLFGAVWADLNRLTTQAELDRFEREWDRRVEAWDRGQQPPPPGWADRAWTAYQHTRGRVLAARVKVGMTHEDVQGIFGAADGQTAFSRDSAGVRCIHLYCPIGVCIKYRHKPAQVNGKGKGDGPLIVYEVEAASLPQIAALLLPHRPRPR
jgi:hypothetical protein